jgi:hypothetical protein
MNIKWQRVPDGWLAYDADKNDAYPLFHLAWRGAGDIHLAGHDRYCVFGRSLYEEYLGDMPRELSEEDAKAAALVLWRLGSDE